MSGPAHLGEAVGMLAQMFPDKIGVRDLDRAMTFRVWNDRSSRLASALYGMGLAKGDRVCILAYNCVEWAEIYAATAMAGIIAVPINFRLVAPEVRYVVENCDAQALIVHDELLDVVEVGARRPARAVRTIHQLWRGPALRWLPRLRRPDSKRARRCTGAGER